MTTNPFATAGRKNDQSTQIEWVENEIKKLSLKKQKLIEKGKEVIEGHLKSDNKGVYKLNVFDLMENIPGDVMKYLTMLYTAAGYHVKIHGDYFHTDKSTQLVKYPNQITLDP